MAEIPKDFHILAPQIGFKPPGQVPALIRAPIDAFPFLAAFTEKVTTKSDPHTIP